MFRPKASCWFSWALFTVWAAAGAKLLNSSTKFLGHPLEKHYSCSRKQSLCMPTLYVYRICAQDLVIACKCGGVSTPVFSLSTVQEHLLWIFLMNSISPCSHWILLFFQNECYINNKISWETETFSHCFWNMAVSHF